MDPRQNSVVEVMAREIVLKLVGEVCDGLEHVKTLQQAIAQETAQLLPRRSLLSMFPEQKPTMGASNDIEEAKEVKEAEEEDEEDGPLVCTCSQCSPIARFVDGCTLVMGGSRGSHKQKACSEQNKESNVEVFVRQLKVYQQYHDGSCGYYALHNLQILMAALATPDEGNARQLMDAMGHAACFWQSYNHNVIRLLKHSADLPQQQSNRYPWDRKSIYQGVLERPYLCCLMAKGDNWNNKFRDHITTLSEVDVAHIPELEPVFRRFQEKTNYFHGFMLGCVQHWNAICASKRGDKFEIVVLDSQNRFQTLQNEKRNCEMMNGNGGVSKLN